MKLEIFNKGNRTRDNMIKTYNYVSYKDEFNNKGEFTIIVPSNEDTLRILTFGNYILFEDGVVGIIRKISNLQEEQGEVTISGTLTNGLLSSRVFLKTSSYYDNITNISRQMVSDLILTPENEKRRIHFIKLSEDEKYIPQSDEKIRKQYTGDNLLTAISELFLPNGYGYELYPVIKNYNKETGQYSNLDNMEFRVIKPKDRTIDNKDGNVPIVFSFDLDNLSRLIYEEDGSDYCTVAIVASEGVGENRKIIEVGDTSKSGSDRFELYVDARDLQTENEDGTTISNEELEELMNQRGLEKLSEHRKFISMDGTINTGSMSYTYKKDFFKGDYVSVYSTELNRYFNLQISSVSKSISNGVEYMDLEFGIDKLTISKLIKNRR